MWLSGFFKVSEEASMRIGCALFVTMQKQNWRRWGWFLSGWMAEHSIITSRPAQPGLPPEVSCRLCHIFIHHVLAHWSYQIFQIFKAVLSIFSIYVGFYNGLWPEKVQHLPHAETGPFPVLGISVLCWSNSDSSFKMFSAAIS